MDRSKKMIITIDGPAGSGKTTVAKIVAKKMNIAYLDTGAMYRGVALILGNMPKDFNYKENVLSSLKFDLVYDGDGYSLAMNNKILGDEIRTEKIGFLASTIAKDPLVRTYLTKQQREIAKRHSLVAEGRDMGTVVFENADFKFFLTASPEIRARRRFEQLKEIGIESSYNEILKDILKRDEQDSSREIAPLKPAEDAVVIDTSNLSIEEVVHDILTQIYQK
ncbi:(d)CMP kinase [Desulfothermus okinawensis JCM 13304]